MPPYMTLEENLAIATLGMTILVYLIPPFVVDVVVVVNHRILVVNCKKKIALKKIGRQP
jgi:hypothetical protein